jgi:hypothetical protein
MNGPNKLPYMGEDPFKDGFLSRSWGNNLIRRQNRDWTVTLPPGWGTGYFVESEENVNLNLSKVKVPKTRNEAALRLHPWQVYISGETASSVSLRINKYSCLMKGQSAHGWLSDWTWEDRVAVNNFDNEFTHASADQIVWLEVNFDVTARMTTSGTSAPRIYSGTPWSNYPKYQNVSPTPIESPFTYFIWRQLLAYWEATTGDMVPDAYFGGNAYTLRCPTTTHLREGIEHGFYDADYTNIVPYACLKPWFGCRFPGSGGN